jgi:hypothetical protein
MFKSISMISDESLKDYQRVPGKLTFAKGVELLKAECDKRAHLQSAKSEATRNSKE